MSLPSLGLAVIGDEVGTSVDEMISFCREHSIARLDMRTVDGRHLLSMSLQEASSIIRQIESAGLRVHTFVSPLLDWAAAGQATGGGQPDFPFDPSQCPREDPLVHAFDIATVLGARKMRVSSYLRYPGYQPKDLFGRYERLIDLAFTYSVTVEIENEPIGNMSSVSDLADYFASMKAAVAPNPLPRNLRPLVNIANAWAIGKPPTDEEIVSLADRIDLIHVKDYDTRTNSAAPLGEGDIPWVGELKRILSASANSKKPVQELMATVEAHSLRDGQESVGRSVAALRRIASQIGVKVT